MAKKNKVVFPTFSAVLLIGILVCCICDLAISRGLTWSLISLISIVFAWLLCAPPLALGSKGLIGSLLSASLFALPYLFLLSRLLRVNAFFSIGAILAALSILYLWIVFAVVKRLGPTRLFTYGIVVLSAVPFLLVLNAALARLISEPFLDIWDILTVAILLVLAIPLLVCGAVKR